MVNFVIKCLFARSLMQSLVCRYISVLFIEEIEKGLEKFSRLGKTYVTGDLNSRTGQLSDFLDYDKYLDDIFQTDDMEDDILNYVDNLSTRRNKDHVIDNNGKKLLSLCKSTNCIIANGRLFQDKEGNYTFCSQRGLSVTDYLLLNINDINAIQNFEILNWTHFFRSRCLIV